MRDYKLNAQLQLIPPTSAEIQSVAKQIQSGLSNVNVNISGKNVTETNKEIGRTKKLLDDATASVNSFSSTFNTKMRSFAAYTAASIPVLKLVDAMREATDQAVRFEAELLKLAQITDSSTKSIKDQASTLTNIAQTYNIAIHKVGQLVGTLAQAGLGFRDAAKAAELIARTSLLSTFDDMTKTTDGFIAVMNTFNLTVTQTGRVLDSINVLSKAYAVESSDLIEAIRRTGGAFAAAGGNVEELLSLITSVRQTTRESAETISTGFRTIFARLQRPQTIEYFKKLGIELETIEGKFVGPYEAIGKISRGLADLNIVIGDIKFAEVAEEIGGIRQISRVIPLLTKYDLTQQALQKTNASSAETFRDLEKAQEGIGYKMGKLQKEFATLFSSLLQSKSVNILIDVFLGISSALLKATEAVSNFLPLLYAAGAVKLGGALTNFQKTGSFGLPKIGKENETESGKPSKTSSFGISSDRSDPASESLHPDIRRGEGKLIETYQDLNERISGLVSELGDVGDKFKNITTNVLKGDNTSRGQFDPNTNEIRSFLNTQKGLTGTTGTADHEFGHAVDFGIGDKKYASETSGTFQNQLVELVKKNIKYEAEKAGFSQATIDYMSKNTELFADFYQKSNPEVRKILASTKDAQIGMAKLAEYLKANKDARLYGEAQNFVKEASEKESLNLINSNDSKKQLGQSIKETSVEIKGVKEAKSSVVTRLDEYDKEIKNLQNKQAKTTNPEGQYSVKRLAQISKLQMERANTQEELLGLENKEKELTRKRVEDIRAYSNIRKTENQSLGNDGPYGPTRPPRPPRPPSGPPPASGGESFFELPKATSRLTKAFWSLYDAASKNSLAMILYSQTLVSLAKQSGFKVNQEALSSGNAKSAVLTMIGSEVKPLGEGLNTLGKMIGKSSPVGHGLRSFGLGLSKLAPAFSSFLNVMGVIQTIGSTLDALFSQDFKGQTDKFIQMGDATSAAASAARAYNQEWYRGIPIVGGFLAALGAGTNATEDQLGPAGKLAVSNARLSASMIRLESDVQRNIQSQKIARNSGTRKEQVEAVTKKLDTVNKFGGVIEENKKRLKEQGTSRESRKEITKKFSRLATGGGNQADPIINWWFQVTEDEKKSAQSIQSAFAEFSKQKEAIIQSEQENMSRLVDQVVRNGGDARAVFKELSASIGEDNFKAIFGDVLNKDSKQIRKDAKDELATNENKVIRARVIASQDIEAGVDPEKANIQIAEAEARRNESQQRLNAIDVQLSEIAVSTQLRRESELRAENLSKEIAALQKYNAYSDNISKQSATFESLSDSMSKIGSGLQDIEGFSRDKGFTPQGLTASSEAIARDPRLLGQHQEFLDKSGNGGQLRQSSETLSTFNKIKDLNFTNIFNDKKRSELKDASIERITSEAQQVANELLGAVGGSNGNKQLEEQVLNFAKDLFTRGQGSEGELLKDLEKDLISKQVSQVDQNKQILLDLQKKTNEYYSAEIKFVNDKIQLARNVYNANKDYASEVIDFTTETSLFLTKGRGRKGQLQEIQSKAGALDAKSRSFGAAGTNVRGTVDGLINRIAGSQDALGGASAAPVEEAKLYADQIRDSIGYEKERLDLMKQSAEVVRDYNQALRDAQGDLVTEFAFGTNDDRANLQRTAAYTQEAAMSGNLNNVPQELRKDISGFLDRFADLELPQFGGQTGSQVKGRIAANEAMSAGLIRPDQVEDFAKKAANDAVPIDQKMAEQIQKQAELTRNLMQEEKLLRDALLSRESVNVDKFGQYVDRLLNSLVAVEGAVLPTNQRIQIEGNQDVTVRMPDIQGLVSTEVSRVAYSAVSDKFKAVSDKLVGVKSPEEIVNAFREASV